MRVFSYIRVSGLGQVDKDGPIRQRNSVQDFCTKFDLNRTAEFFEEGISGTVDALERPAFADMLTKVDAFNKCERESGAGVIGIEAIVVERIDRLARDLMVSEFLLAECRKRGIKVFAADQGALVDVASNDGDPTRKLMRQILGAIAEWDKSVTVRKLRAARKRYRDDNGKCEGIKPYGALPGEREVMEFIHKERQAGNSFDQVALILNMAGMKTRFGKSWKKSTVYSVYTGRRCKHKPRLNKPIGY